MSNELRDKIVLETIKKLGDCVDGEIRWSHGEKYKESILDNESAIPIIAAAFDEYAEELRKDSDEGFKNGLLISIKRTCVACCAGTPTRQHSDGSWWHNHFCESGLETACQANGIHNLITELKKKDVKELIKEYLEKK